MLESRIQIPASSRQLFLLASMLGLGYDADIRSLLQFASSFTLSAFLPNKITMMPQNRSGTGGVLWGAQGRANTTHSPPVDGEVANITPFIRTALR